MAADVRYVEWLVRLLAFIGGVVSTVAGSWISSKIHVYHDNRKAHLDDLKQRVLVPLRNGLEKHFRPLVFHQVPVVFVQLDATTQFDEKAKATEEPGKRGEVILGAFPSAAVFASLDSALLEDAKNGHFRNQLSEVDKFIRDWVAYAAECHRWVLKISREILTKSALPTYPPLPGPGFSPYVMNHRLAVFVYMRLFRLPTTALRLEDLDNSSTLSGGSGTLALGSKTQVENVLKQIDALLESEEAIARTLRDKAGALQAAFQEIIPKLDYAAASRRLRKRCDLVTFF